jgi:hypothetical protein
MLVDGDGEFLFGVFLTDDVFIKEGFDVQRLGQRRTRCSGFLLRIIADDLNTNINALVANVNGGACDEFFDFVLAFAAEATT